MSYVKGLKCRECGTPYPVEPLAICEECFGPLEVDYDYEAISETLTREGSSSRPRTLVALPRAAAARGRADRRPADRGVRRSCAPIGSARRSACASSTSRTTRSSHPTLSFKDRVVAVALSQGARVRLRGGRLRLDRQPRQLGRRQCRRGRLPRLHPHPGRSREEQRSSARRSSAPTSSPSAATTTMSTGSAARSPDGTAGPSSTSTCGRSTREGSKTFGYEIAEQLGWRAPDAVVVPMAGGSLITKIHKALQRARAARADRDGRDAQILRRPGHGLQSDRRRRSRPGPARSSPGQAEHDRQVARHRQPGRRLLRHRRHRRDGRLGRGRDRRGDRRGDPAARPRRKASSPRPPAGRRSR